MAAAPEARPPSPGSRAAVLFTGRPRVLRRTARMILDHLLAPNRALVFIACECPTDADRALVEEVAAGWSRAGKGVEVAACITPGTYRTPAFNAFLEFVLEHREATCAAGMAAQGNYPQSYLRSSGSVVEYEQYRAAQGLLARWSAEHPAAAREIDVVVRARFDVVLTRPLHLVRFFGEVDEPMLREFGEAAYVRSLGDRRIAAAWAEGRIRRTFAYPSAIPAEENGPGGEPCAAAVLARIRAAPAIWTLYCQWLWVARPAVMASLAGLVWEYGLETSPLGLGPVVHHAFNAENQFHFAVARRGLALYAYYTDAENEAWALHEGGAEVIAEHSEARPAEGEGGPVDRGPALADWVDPERRVMALVRR
jgi:hypothetical protein